MKRMLYNGKIYVEKGRFAQAVCWEDDRIIAVGSDDHVRAAAGLCEATDLRGKTVIPGLNDSHLHITGLGARMATADIVGCTSIDEVIARCRAFIAHNPQATGKGLYAGGWNQDLFTGGEKRYLYRWDLDRIATDIPIVLSRICGHIVAANSKAMELAGIGPGTPQFEGGTFGLDQEGRPDGHFTELACGAVTAVIPPPDSALLEALTLKAMDYCVAHGLTSIQSNDIHRADDPAFQMLRNIYQSGRGKVRYHHQMCFQSPEDFGAFLAPNGQSAHPFYSGNDWLTLGCLKLFKDGSLGARTATVRRAYLDDPQNCGVEAMSAQLAREYVALAAQNSVQIITHAIGDKAIVDTLDAYETVLANGQNPLRHSIVHYQCVDPDIIARTARLGVLAQVQPIFLTTDIHAVPTRFPESMNRWFLAFRSYLEAGIPVSFGSDAPVEDCNPFLGIYCAVTRQDVSGRPQGGFFPQECIHVADAIDCYTAGSAYAQFQETVKGRLKPGMLADMVVLDRDIFTCDVNEIKDIKPLETLVGGRTMYKA